MTKDTKVKKRKRKTTKDKIIFPHVRRLPRNLVRRPVPVVEVPVHSLNRSSCVHAYNNYKEGQLMGEGLFSNVYELCDEKKSCPYVLKVMQLPTLEPRVVDIFMQKLQKEVANQKKAAGIAPKVYDAWTCAQHDILTGFIVMERMDGTLGNYILKEYHEGRLSSIMVDYLQLLMIELVAKLHQLGICHNDLHFGNILYKKDKWYVGDFGESTTNESEEILAVCDKWFLDSFHYNVKQLIGQ